MDTNLPGSCDVRRRTSSNVKKARPQVEPYPAISEALGNAIVGVLLGKVSPQDALDQAAAGHRTRRWPEADPVAARTPLDTPTSGRRRRYARLARSEHAVGWAFVTPGDGADRRLRTAADRWSLVLSFQKSDLLTPETPWVGLKNYREIAARSALSDGDRSTRSSTRRCSCPATMIVGVLVAVALNRTVRGISVYRTAAYVTMAVSTINEAIIFIWLFEPYFGIVNAALNAVGIRPAAVARRPRPGALRHRRDDGLGMDGVRRRRLPRGAAGRPAGAARGRRDRRGATVHAPSAPSPCRY